MKLDVLNEPHTGIDGDSLPPITKLMYACWLGEPELQQEFPLSTHMGRIAYSIWFRWHARTRYGLDERFLPQIDWEALNALQNGLPADGLLPITKLMYSTWLAA